MTSGGGVCFFCHSNYHKVEINIYDADGKITQAIAQEFCPCFSTPQLEPHLLFEVDRDKLLRECMMTEHVHEWAIAYDVMEERLWFGCVNGEDCDAELDHTEAEARLNATEPMNWSPPEAWSEEAFGDGDVKSN